MQQDPRRTVADPGKRADLRPCEGTAGCLQHRDNPVLVYWRGTATHWQPGVLLPQQRSHWRAVLLMPGSIVPRFKNPDVVRLDFVKHGQVVDVDAVAPGHFRPPWLRSMVPDPRERA